MNSNCESHTTPIKTLEGEGQFSKHLQAVCICLAIAMAPLLTACSKNESDMKITYILPDGTRTSDLQKIKEAEAKFEVSGHETVPNEAKRLHEEGRELGAKQNYMVAAAMFEKASSLAPDWPYPKYDLAYMRLMLGDAKNALVLYKEVDRMSPKGFFTAKTAIWTLEREASGAFPEHTYWAYVLGEALGMPQRRELMEKMINKVPTFAPAWKELFYLSENDPNRDAYLAKALSLNPDADTYGICKINFASRIAGKGDIESAKKILTELISDEASTSGNVTLAKAILHNLVN